MTCSTDFPYPITLNGLAFNTGSGDGNGTLWEIDVFAMDGWASPPLRQTLGHPTSVHGAVVEESMLDARTITLPGLVRANSRENYWIAFNELQGLVNNLITPTVLEVGEIVPKTLGVVRGSMVKAVHQGPFMFAFEIDLIAPDPVKLSASVVVPIASGVTSTVAVDGNWQTWPSFVLSGTVDLHGGAYRFNTAGAALAGGSVLNMKKHTLTSGGVSQYARISPAAQWWALQPGSNTIHNAGTADVLMTYSPAWL